MAFILGTLFRRRFKVLLPVPLVVLFEIVLGIGEGRFITLYSRNCHLFRYSTLRIEEIKMGKIMRRIVSTDHVKPISSLLRTNQDQRKIRHFSRQPLILSNDPKSVR